MAQEFEDDSMLVELEDGFKELVRTIVKNMNELKTVEQTGIRDMIDQIKSDLKECGTTIREMKLELKALNNKTNWSNVINKHETNYQNLKIKFEKEKEKAQRRDIYYKHDVKQESMLQQAKQNTNMLKEAQMKICETEANALDTMDTLNDQTEQIKGIHAKVKASNNLLDNMGSTIKKMKRRWWA